VEPTTIAAAFLTTFLDSDFFLGITFGTVGGFNFLI